jgi:hypothetical protein
MATSIKAYGNIKKGNRFYILYFLLNRKNKLNISKIKLIIFLETLIFIRCISRTHYHLSSLSSPFGNRSCGTNFPQALNSFTLILEFLCDLLHGKNAHYFRFGVYSNFIINHGFFMTDFYFSIYPSFEGG